MPTQRPSTVRHRAALFEEAAAIVDGEYASELTLDDLARRIATSRRQLQRSFAEVGETTFRDYVTDVRMAKAAGMLADPGLTVGKVSRAVGYRQQAQFAKAFRRRYGMAPGEYRRDIPPSADGYAAPDSRARSGLDGHGSPAPVARADGASPDGRGAARVDGAGPGRRPGAGADPGTRNNAATADPGGISRAIS